MKTKLLCLLLLVTFGTFAQINVSESFETSFPAGWSTTGQSAGFTRGTYSYSCDQSYAMQAGLYPSNSNAMIVTSNYVSDGNSIVVSFDYNRGVGAVSGNVYLYYDVNNANSWQQIATTADLSPGCKTLRGVVLGSLAPAGSNVRFRMQINSTSNISVFIDNFKAIQKPFEFEYTFNSTTANTDGLFPFTVANTSYVEDRNGNANSALQINANVSGSQTVIPMLPTSNASRSFSLWYKTSTNLNANIFTYGTACQDCNFGTYLGGNGNPVFQSYISDTNFGGNYAVNTWHHIVVTYNGTQVKMYMNGALLGTQAYNLVTGSNFAFRLGGNVSTLTVDDLRMFERAITDAEVSNLFNYNSIVTPPLPIINTTTKKPGAINATLYSEVNSNGSSISSAVVKYGLSSANLDNQVNAVGISPNYYYGTIINGLLENTTYYYKIEMTNANGTTSSAIDSFVTGSKQTVAEYSFDNVYTNLSGNNAFASSAGTSFGNDRNNNPNSALVVNNTSVNGQIPGLPIDGSTRTISIWAKVNSTTSPNYVFSYGGILTDLAFINVINSNSLDFQSFSNGFQVTETNPANTWMHLVYTYDGVNVRMYKNGVLKGTSPFNLFTAFDADYFYLASIWGSTNTFNGSLDDLKIYNYTLTDTEISNLYNYNSLASEDFTLENNIITLYPNPVKDILNIKTALEIQSVEIYTIQGQKVASSTEKQINVSHLASGIYLVKTQDSNNKISTNKIIIQ